ncbi:transposon Tf2-9 polyprotein [Elysia marginata]|uniref:Transposon Tf2-9 polyprotein n=1 Tax=Elysia marginata TaxID=1093978 RepID=A0AAV4GD56_9GAST|nr:transposon Tf2-9 polyprotein [Elysia marginata]
MPQLEELMRRLGRGHCFTKIDLADTYNQIRLGPESQKKLALSTHRGVLLQKRLPFGITSAPDDILVSGNNAEQHLLNLRGLLQRLQDKGLRCRLEKCAFAQPYVEYLGHYLSKNGIAKGPKADAVKKMPAPTNVSSLRSFMGQVHFYSKFLPSLSTTLEPLYHLTKKDVPWRWGKPEQEAFQHVKNLLSADTVLAHFNPALEVGISCDASDVGIGCVLFHRYSDGSERPFANASKTLTQTQRKYSQIQKEALANIFGLNKFHQFLYGRRYILVTDHKPLIALFGPTKPTPALAANRLARWALTVSQYDYTIEYRKTSAHGNADALSRLPAGADPSFDRRRLFLQSTWHCTACNEHQRLPSKQPSHPWITPEKPCSQVHIDHAINFKGHNWLVMVNAHSKYPCIHPMSSISTKATTRRLDEDFAHLGYPHAIVTDNTACFLSTEFQTWCEQRGIQHLHGAPYHPETNGAAERLVQTFKESLKKSDLPPANALQEFLMLHRRTPLASGTSPSELLNGRQIRTKRDIIIPAQTKTSPRVREEPSSARRFRKDGPCFALSYKRGLRDGWKPAVVTANLGHKYFEVRVVPDGPT